MVSLLVKWGCGYADSNGDTADNNRRKKQNNSLRRVSSDSADQLNSFMAQLKYYENFLADSKTETLINVYADDGISGTNTKKREEFNRMIEECMAGYIDMVITKSISRFARNTLDCLKYIRLLKEKNIPVFFEKENINTLTMTSEFMIALYGSFAQAVNYSQ